MSRLSKNLGYVATLAALLVGAALLAQTSGSRTARQSIGALDSIDIATTSILVRTDNQAQNIAYDAATVIVDHGARVELASLHRGDKLKVEWYEREGRKVALRIEILEKTPELPGAAVY